MNRLVLLLCLFGGTISGFGEEPTVFIIPKDADVFFKNYYYTGSEYFQFSTNGIYRQITREHMFTKESDHGTWSQNGSGELTLVSYEHYRNIECEPLSIFMWYTQAIERLPWVKEQIMDILTRSDMQTFTKEQIEGIEKYGYENCLSRVSVDFDVEHVRRDKLKELAGQIDRFLNDEERNHFHTTPMTYKGHTFLLWRDAETPVNRDLVGIVKSLDELKTEDSPAHIFTRIDGETFKEESGKTQEFIFYPEMTEKVRATIQSEKKELPTTESSVP